MNVNVLKDERRTLIDEQGALFEKHPDGDFPEDVAKRFDELNKDIRERTEKIQRAEDRDANAALKEAGIRPDPQADADQEREDRKVSSLGTQFTESPQYQAMRSRGFRGAYTSGAVELRTLLDSSAGSGGDAIIADNQPGIRPLRLRRLTVADLVLPGTTDSNTVSYVEEQTFTNAAAAVTEGDAKPETALVLNLVSESVRKLAHWIPVTDEMLEDVSQLRSFIDNRLVIGLQLEEEDQILNGDGTPPNISGILDRSGLQTEIDVGAATAADSVYQQVTAIREDFYEPNGMVINPTDWGSADFRLAKDANEQYFAGGPFTGQYGNGAIVGETFWGLQVVVTSAIASGTVLVGDFTQAQMFRKSGITVEASNSHSDYFVKNKTAIRAEERLALAVYAPGAFGVVDLTP